MTIYFRLLTLMMMLGSSGMAFADPCEVLGRIAQRADETASDIVLVVKDGQVIGCFGAKKAYTPIDTRSITKTFVGLATGMLLQEKNFGGIDTTIYTYYPEWNQGIKKQVAIRHLLSHTSGLLAEEEGVDYYKFPDAIQMALVSDFYKYPGCAFQYSNKGTNLLAGVVQRASGIAIHDYLRGRLFAPLNITSETWLCDASGNNYGMSHLSMNAMDLAKIGMLIAQDGVFNGFQYVPKSWIEFIKRPDQAFTPFYGVLVWLGYHTLDIHWDDGLIDMYRAGGVNEEYVKALELLQGQIIHLEGNVNYGNFRLLCESQLAPIFGGSEAIMDFFSQVEKLGLPVARWKEGHLMSVAARGYGGQQMIVFPEQKLVGIRLSASPNYDNFADFEFLLTELLYQMGLE